MREINLFKVWQDKNNDYDTFDSAVICATTKAEAKKLSIELLNDNPYFPSWVNELDEVKCILIGKAKSDIKKGIIVASFNAG